LSRQDWPGTCLQLPQIKKEKKKKKKIVIKNFVSFPKTTNCLVLRVVSQTNLKSVFLLYSFQSAVETLKVSFEL
jgi:hypothetical protein